MIADKNYPFNKLLKGLNEKSPNPTEIDTKMRQEIRNMLYDPDRRLKALSMHDMFKQLSGNPTSICMIAAMLKNPLIKKNEANPLVDLYMRIKSEKDIVISELVDDGRNVHRMHKNEMSLKVSAEMSLKLLEENSPEDMSLLYFLGCLPGGVKESQLKKMYNRDIGKSL